MNAQDFSQILIVPELLEQQEIDNLIKEFLKIEPKMPFIPSDNRKRIIDYATDDIRRVFLKIVKAVKAVTGTKDLFVSEHFLSIYDEGSFIFPHLDQETQWSGHFVRSCVLYLNSNYEGGEVYFPLNHDAVDPNTLTHYTPVENDFVYAPNSGDVVAFPADFLHGVNKVTKGRRYAIPFWLTDNPNLKSKVIYPYSSTYWRKS